MKSVLQVSLIALALTCVAPAQDANTPKLRAGIKVQMAVAPSAVAVPDADQESATVVAITAANKIYSGTRPVDLSALSTITASPVYIKADAHANYQTVLNVLDALKGHSIVLLTANTAAKSSKITPPYGVPITFGTK